MKLPALLALLALLACATAPEAAPAAASAPGAHVVAPIESKSVPPRHDEEPSPGFRLPKGVRPLAYQIHLALDPEQPTFTGQATLRVRVDAPRRAIWLHARGLDVTEARVGGQAARFAQVDDDGMARLAVDRPVSGDVDVELSWTAKYSDQLEGVYRVRSEDEWYVFTQFEAVNARDSFPCFDEPGFKAPFTMSFTTKKGDVIVANTLPASTRAEGEQVRTTFAPTQPLPTYLLAFAVGPLEIVEGVAAPTPIRAIVAKGKAKQYPQEIAYSLDVTAKALASLEKYFGIPYPYGKLDFVAVPDFAAGAMENAGLVTYRDSLLFVDTGSPIGMQKGNAHVIAHELAHQWFGNYVTLAWWDDIWLNEAFASWAQTFVVSEIRPDLNARTDARASADWVMGEDSLVSARKIREPVLSKDDIVNAFDGITYTKGAAVIAMFEQLIGADAFQQGVRAYLKERAHGTATATDLLQALSKAGGTDVTTPFSTFLDQPGVPFLQARVACEAKGARLEVAQSRYLPLGSTGDRNKTWQVPVCVRTGPHDVKGGSAAACHLVTKATDEVPLGATCPKGVPFPNRDGVGYFRWSLPGDDMRRLASSLAGLSAGERISFANAVRGGAWAGTLSYADTLAAAKPLAKDEEPKVANTPYGLYVFAWAELVDPAARPLVLRELADVYRPVLAGVGFTPKPDEDPRRRERRTLALAALALAEDEKTMSALARLGEKVLAGGKVDLDAAPADLVSGAIAAYVKRGGDAAWDQAAALLSTETSSLARTYLLSALGSVDDLPRGKKALALALDPRLKVNEVRTPLWGQLGNPLTRAQAWAWGRANADAVLARLPEHARGGALPWLVGGGACDEAEAARIEAFVNARPDKDKLPGLDRALAQTVEGVRLCAARKAFHEESARKQFPAPRAR